jgi:very-short-patch-repair endonuclease
MEKKMFYGATPNSFQKAKSLRSQMTRHEEMLWERLRKKQILGVRIKCQHPIGTYIADFYCHVAKLVIEIDGEYHNTTNQQLYDKERTFNFGTDGLKVIRFSNHEVEYDLDRVIREITKQIEERLLENT